MIAFRTDSSAVSALARFEFGVEDCAAGPVTDGSRISEKRRRVPFYQILGSSQMISQISANMIPDTARIFLSRVANGKLFAVAVAMIAASGTDKRCSRRRAPAVRTICISTGITMKSLRKFSIAVTSDAVSEESESASIADTDEMNSTVPDSRHACRAFTMFVSPFKYPIKILLSSIMRASVFQTISFARPTPDASS